MNYWFYKSTDEEEMGPVSAEILRELAEVGEISPDTPVRSQDSDDWFSAGRLDGIFEVATEDAEIDPFDEAVDFSPAPAIPFAETLQPGALAYADALTEASSSAWRPVHEAIVWIRWGIVAYVAAVVLGLSRTLLYALFSLALFTGVNSAVRTMSTILLWGATILICIGALRIARAPIVGPRRILGGWIVGMLLLNLFLLSDVARRGPHWRINWVAWLPQVLAMGLLIAMLWTLSSRLRTTRLRHLLRIATATVILSGGLMALTVVIRFSLFSFDAWKYYLVFTWTSIVAQCLFVVTLGQLIALLAGVELHIWKGQRGLLRRGAGEA